MLKKKITISGVLSILLILSSVLVTFAQNYNKVYVYGARYTVAAAGTSENTADYLTVTVTKIYKENGDDSTYGRVLGEVMNDSGDQISTVLGVPLDVQVPTNIELIEQFDARTPMKIRMKGNKPYLDCQVDFTAALAEE